MADDVRKLNEPENIIDFVDKDTLKNCWSDIREIIHSVPSLEACTTAMKKAGCKTTIEEIGKEKRSLTFAKSILRI